MSEEILTKESEEMTEEELAEKQKVAAAEQDSSDEEEDEEEVEEGKSTKASVKKEEDDEEEDEEEPEVAEGKSSVKKEEGEEEEEGDEDEEEVPAESKKAKKESVIPSTKNQMLKNIYDEVNKMLKSDLAGKYEQIMASTSLETVKEVKETRTKAAVTKEDIEKELEKLYAEKNIDISSGNVNIKINVEETK